MDAELKAKWIKALRSGEYQQARGSLKHKGAFCCLGVLCDVMGFKFDEEESLQEPKWDGEYSSILPLTGFQAEALWRRNDGAEPHREHSFTEIADFIEANL